MSPRSREEVTRELLPELHHPTRRPVEGVITVLAGLKLIPCWIPFNSGLAIPSSITIRKIECSASSLSRCLLVSPINR